MNSEAAALGPQFSVFTGATGTAPPASTSYTPASYLRPFNLFPLVRPVVVPVSVGNGRD
jgi:hypothetical protein